MRLKFSGAPQNIEIVSYVHCMDGLAPIHSNYRLPFMILPQRNTVFNVLHPSIRLLVEGLQLFIHFKVSSSDIDSDMDIWSAYINYWL